VNRTACESFEVARNIRKEVIDIGPPVDIPVGQLKRIISKLVRMIERREEILQDVINNFAVQKEIEEDA